MAKQLIFCVETKKQADTDTIYIRETIKHWYKLDNQIKISIINMNSKSKYNAKDVKKQISEKQKLYTIGDTQVIFFIDTDQYEKNPDHERELNEISHYCNENHFDLVWFCHNIEEVFWGHNVSDSKKVREATAFRKKRLIESVKIGMLSSDAIRIGVSNIMLILDKYMERNDKTEK